jgi:uncharacterized membrane protein YidH (DUF202 family)
VDESLAAERAAARYLTALALATMGVALGWFAYIDAPITDRVMLSIAVAVLAGVVAALSGLAAYALTLRPPAAGGTPEAAMRGARRLRRLAMWALASLVVVMALAVVATLNVKGADETSDAEDTAVAV